MYYYRRKILFKKIQKGGSYNPRESNILTNLLHIIEGRAYHIDSNNLEEINQFLIPYKYGFKIRLNAVYDKLV